MLFLFILLGAILVAGGIGWLYDELTREKKFMALSPEEQQKQIQQGWEELQADADWQQR